jgi:hypothetical protein
MEGRRALHAALRNLLSSGSAVVGQAAMLPNVRIECRARMLHQFRSPIHRITQREKFGLGADGNSFE